MVQSVHRPGHRPDSSREPDPDSGAWSGRPRLIELRADPIRLEEAYLHVAAPSLGGTALFVGSVRPDITDRGPVERLEYEAYAGVAEKVMDRIACEAERLFGAGHTAIVHRVGVLLPGEMAVVAAAACPHRSDAFSACRYLIDEVKVRVPIWKREWAGGEGKWVPCSHGEERPTAEEHPLAP